MRFTWDKEFTRSGKVWMVEGERTLHVEKEREPFEY